MLTPMSAFYSENEIRGNARPHPALTPGEGEACIVTGNFHAFWCGIAPWGLTSAATVHGPNALSRTMEALQERKHHDTP